MPRPTCRWAPGWSWACNLRWYSEESSHNTGTTPPALRRTVPCPVLHIHAILVQWSSMLVALVNLALAAAQQHACVHCVLQHALRRHPHFAAQPAHHCLVHSILPCCALLTAEAPLLFRTRSKTWYTLQHAAEPCFLPVQRIGPGRSRTLGTVSHHSRSFSISSWFEYTVSL